NNNMIVIKKIFEKILIHYQKSNAYEVNNTKLKKITIRDCWLAIMTAACIQNNHDFIIHFVDCFVPLQLGFSNLMHSFRHSSILQDFINYNKKEIKYIIMNAIEKQKESE